MGLLCPRQQQFFYVGIEAGRQAYDELLARVVVVDEAFALDFTEVRDDAERRG